jgi:hypothetical protein
MNGALHYPQLNCSIIYKLGAGAESSKQNIARAAFGGSGGYSMFKEVNSYFLLS